MPNQLAESKKRKTVAEHAAVLALLDRIATEEHTTSTALLRRAARSLVRSYAGNPKIQDELRRLLESYKPELPLRAKNPKVLSRFKQASREYDALTVDLGFNLTTDIQQRNSLHKQVKAPILIGSL